MARVNFGIERAIRVYKENSDTSFIDYLFGAGAPLGTSGETDEASIGSQYNDVTNGFIYIKKTDTSSAGDWDAVGNVALTALRWRNERVVAATNDSLSAGAGQDPTAWTDNDSGVDATNWVVGNYVIGDVDGVPALWEITAKASATSITLAAASQAIVDGDTFIVQSYLPDPGATQESQAILHIPVAGSPGIKISDFDWNLADGINLPSGYAAGNGTISSADTVNTAIQKLDGNQQDIQTASGISQGAVDYGPFTGDIISDNVTNKVALQELETELVDTRQNVDDLISLSGVAENAVNLGTWTSPVDLLFSATSTVKALFQRIGDLLMQLRGVQVTGITTAATVDSVIVDDVKAVKWLVQVFEEATPANVKAFEIFAAHNGTAAADATSSDDTVYSKLKIGSNFNLTLSVDLNGAAGSQVMRLRAASTSAGVTVTARRIEVLKSVL